MKSRKIKVVGWDYHGQKGSISLRYQLSGSPLSKFKVSVDNRVYLTLRQFYRNKVKNKKALTFKKLEEEAKALPVVPLMISSRAYPAYAVADLKRLSEDYLNNTTNTKVKIATPKKVSADIDVETAVMISQSSQGDATSKVSNPIKKKSFFSTITSLFKKKEKVHS
jgi:hypothetical protein